MCIVRNVLPLYYVNMLLSIQKQLVGFLNGNTVQLKVNFTHAWWSAHGYMQIFACKIKNFLWKSSFLRDVEYHETWSTTRCGIPRDMKCHVYMVTGPDGAYS